MSDRPVMIPSSSSSSSSSSVGHHQLSVVALDHHSVTLSWLPARHAHAADADAADGDVVMYELSYWRSGDDALSRSTTTAAVVMGQTENVTLFGLRPQTTYCFTVRHTDT